MSQVVEQVVEQTKRPETDLAVCPAELLPLDPNAPVLWIQFLRRTGVPMSAKGKRGAKASEELWVDNNSRRAVMIRSFGITSLIQRLPAAKDEIQRARVWWREAAACSEGDSVPDLSSDNMAVLNPFIVTKELKFKDTRFESIKKAWATAQASQAQDPIKNTHKRVKLARACREAAKTRAKNRAKTRIKRP